MHGRPLELIHHKEYLHHENQQRQNPHQHRHDPHYHFSVVLDPPVVLDSYYLTAEEGVLAAGLDEVTLDLGVRAGDAFALFEDVLGLEGSSSLPSFRAIESSKSVHFLFHSNIQLN